MFSKGRINQGKFKWFWALALILAFFVGLVPVKSWGASSGVPSGQKVVGTPKILQTCAVVPDKELGEMRGCFASYYFALDVGINMASPNPNIRVNFRANVASGSGTPNTTPNFTGNTASFNNGSVNFSATIGNTPMGNGVFNVVQVAGNNNVVISTTNIYINCGNIGVRPLQSFLSTPLSLAGIHH